MVSEEKIIKTVLTCHCGGACVFRVHEKNGIVNRIETGVAPFEELKERYGPSEVAEGFKGSDKIKPSVIFKAKK